MLSFPPPLFNFSEPQNKGVTTLNKQLKSQLCTSQSVQALCYFVDAFKIVMPPLTLF